MESELLRKLKYLTWFVGPAIAGLSVAWLGYEPVLILDAVSFIICALFLLLIPSSLHTPGIPFSQLSKNLDGVRMLRDSRLLLQLAGLTFFFNFFFGGGNGLWDHRWRQ